MSANPHLVRSIYTACGRGATKAVRPGSLALSRVSAAVEGMMRGPARIVSVETDDVLSR